MHGSLNTPNSPRSPVVVSLCVGGVSSPGVSAESEPPQAGDLLAVELDGSDSLAAETGGQGGPHHVLEALAGVKVWLTRVVDDEPTLLLLQLLSSLDPILQLLQVGNSKPDSGQKLIMID